MDFASLERLRLAAIVNGDRSELQRLHAPDFVLCSPSGQIWDRRTYVDGLCDGWINYHRFEPLTEIDVLAASDFAVVRYKSSIDIAVNHKAPAHFECWHLDVYSRGSAHDWQAKWSQATIIS